MKRLIQLCFLLFPLLIWSPAEATAPRGLYQSNAQQEILSPIWPPIIRQWSTHIGVLSQTYGIDPDLIAAVITEESDGIPDGISRVGAVGLMGVMPSGPGMEWRPSTEELLVPATNLRWGVAILSSIIRQSGGDISAALAAYSGGWDHANKQVPLTYSQHVLNNYGRAVAARNGVSPDIAAQWTIAIEMRNGNVPSESLLILGEQPVSGLDLIGEHIAFESLDVDDGRSFLIKAYAIPVAVVVPDPKPIEFGSGDTVNTLLQVRLGHLSAKEASHKLNERVLSACLPSLTRLRGQVSTRWYAPSYCPSWHR